MTGYRSKEKTEKGKRKIVFNHKFGYIDQPVTIPCGQCIGCRLERSRQWAIRCVHEASLHEDNCFITLTYNNENLPKDGSLQLSDFQKFMKRLRKHFYGTTIRFFHCGEYGAKFARPHYHACIFGLDFQDKQFLKTVNGNHYYTSPTLHNLWSKGFHTIGDVSFESAAYVARYITKKITGKAAVEYYETGEICETTGEIFSRKPEYTTMSRRPGIGKKWFDKYMADVFPGDFVLLKDKKLKPPKYYDKLYEIECPGDFKKLKYQRDLQTKENQDNNTPERLEVREFIHKDKTKTLTRRFENEP